VAVTQCIIVGTILGLVGTSIPGLLYLVAALVYLFFAVKSISSIPEVHDDEDQITGSEEIVLDKSSQMIDPPTESQRTLLTATSR
jgi:hypothetical protein